MPNNRPEIGSATNLNNYYNSINNNFQQKGFQNANYQQINNPNVINQNPSLYQLEQKMDYLLNEQIAIKNQISQLFFQQKQYFESRINEGF